MPDLLTLFISNVRTIAAKSAFHGVFLAVLAWSCTTLWPWVQDQAELWRTGQSLMLPQTGEGCLALIIFPATLITWFCAYFLVNVWRELERDKRIYKSTASTVSTFAAKALQISQHHWDAAKGWFIRNLSWFSFTRRYLRELPRLRGLLDVRNLVMMQANHLELEDVYIELRAACRTAGRPANPNPVARELRDDRATIWEYLRIAKEGVALAIVGAPGSGKSTLLKHLLLKYAWNHQWRYRVHSRIPFFIELRKLPGYIDQRIGSLPDVLSRLLQDEEDLKTTVARMPNGWVQKLLEQGRCILLCDGLDEIPNVEKRKAVSAWLNKQINHTSYRGNLFLVTARPVGYQSAPLIHVLNLEVQPFDWNDTRRFIERWYAANRVITMKPGTPGKVIQDTARQDADSLLSKLRNHKRLHVLTSNPLLLTMVCLMHEIGQLPGSRSQLYREICEVHLERWRRREGANKGRKTWNAEQKLAVLRPLAHHLMMRGYEYDTGRQQDSKSLSTDDLLNVCKKSLDDIGVKADREARTAFFDDLHNDSGLLLQLEPNTWGFAHLSFQEYLCADYWCTNPAGKPQRQDWPTFLEQSWWRETLLLYASKAIDIRPLIEAALTAKTAQSLSFLFALEGEAVSIPADQEQHIEKELYAALASHDEAVFDPAAKALLLRQQEVGYSRVSEGTELSDWVSQAEYQLYLNSRHENSPFGLLSQPLHQTERFFKGDPRSPALGMKLFGAEGYCKWLDEQFPEFEHMLPDERYAETFLRINDSEQGFWTKNMSVLSSDVASLVIFFTESSFVNECSLLLSNVLSRMVVDNIHYKSRDIRRGYISLESMRDVFSSVVEDDSFGSVLCDSKDLFVSSKRLTTGESGLRKALFVMLSVAFATEVRVPVREFMVAVRSKGRRQRGRTKVYSSVAVGVRHFVCVMICSIVPEFRIFLESVCTGDRPLSFRSAPIGRWLNDLQASSTCSIFTRVLPILSPLFLTEISLSRQSSLLRHFFLGLVGEILKSERRGEEKEIPPYFVLREGRIVPGEKGLESRGFLYQLEFILRSLVNLEKSDTSISFGIRVLRKRRE